jgi:ABC-2 type transport system permease protein
VSAIAIILRLTVLEAARRRILLAALVLGGLFLVLFSLGFYFMRGTVSEIGMPDPAARVGTQEFYNFILMAGLYAISFLSIAMGAMLAADTLAGEIGSGTVQSLVTKPVRRADIVVGKWLGFAVLLAGYLLLMAGGILLSVWLQTGYTVPRVWTGLGLMYLECLLVMTVTLAGSSMLSTLATGGVVFGLYGIAFLGGWVEQIGALAGNPTAVNIGILSSLIIPSEAIWRRAAFEMTSPLVRVVGFSPFSAASAPSGLMLIYAGIYLAAALALALRQFNRRDL